MIYVQAWTNHLGIKTQALRELNIQIAKLQRLTEEDDFYFMQRVDSLKKVKRLESKNAHQIGLQHEKVLSLVEKVFQEAAMHRGEGPLSEATLRKRLHGENGFISEVKEYGRRHPEK